MKAVIYGVSLVLITVFIGGCSAKKSQHSDVLDRSDVEFILLPEMLFEPEYHEIYEVRGEDVTGAPSITGMFRFMTEAFLFFNGVEAVPIIEERQFVKYFAGVAVPQESVQIRHFFSTTENARKYLGFYDVNRDIIYSPLEGDILNAIPHLAKIGTSAVIGQYVPSVHSEEVVTVSWRLRFESEEKAWFEMIWTYSHGNGLADKATTGFLIDKTGYRFKARYTYYSGTLGHEVTLVNGDRVVGSVEP